jgi:hypothetical protein
MALTYPVVQNSQDRCTGWRTRVKTTDVEGGKIIYWYRELPPLGAEQMIEHVVEATSSRVPGTLLHRDELWNQCYEDLMEKAEARLTQEVIRLGGDYAHVLNESVDSRHDDKIGQAWLHGRFSYMLYRREKRQANLSLMLARADGAYPEPDGL